MPHQTGSGLKLNLFGKQVKLSYDDESLTERLGNDGRLLALLAPWHDWNLTTQQLTEILYPTSLKREREIKDPQSNVRQGKVRLSNLLIEAMESRKRTSEEKPALVLTRLLQNMTVDVQDFKRGISSHDMKIKEEAIEQYKGHLLEGWENWMEGENWMLNEILPLRQTLQEKYNAGFKELLILKQSRKESLRSLIQKELDKGLLLEETLNQLRQILNRKNDKDFNESLDKTLSERDDPFNPKTAVREPALSVQLPAVAGAPPSNSERYKTLVFTDLEASTKQYDQIGNSFYQYVHRHERLLLELAEEYDGERVKGTGDGVFLAFENAGKAVQFAMAVQERLPEQVWQSELPRPLRVRIGMRTGKAIFESKDGDYRGRVPNEAARILGMTPAGSIFVCNATRDEARAMGLVGDEFVDLGIYKTDKEAIPLWLYAVSGYRRYAPVAPVQATKIEQKSLVRVENVPYYRNEYFTGREGILEALVKSFDAGPIVALYGLGGIGKTQTAVEYFYRYGEAYSAVLWCRADTTDALDASYVEIARLLRLSKAQPKEAVVNWLGDPANKGYLLILDNADNTNLIKAFLPPPGKRIQGHVLLTSRTDHFDASIKPVPVPRLTTDKATAFLFARTGREREANPDEEAQAKEIAEALGGLPLALEQAAAYITEQKATFAEYFYEFATRRSKVDEVMRLPETGIYRRYVPDSDPWKEQLAVWTTWEMNFADVEKDASESAQLLQLSAFFAADEIPMQLIVKAMPEAFGGQQNEIGRGIQFRKLLLPLTRYSLASYDAKTRAFSIHRMVQTVLRDRMEASPEEQKWAERAVLAINKMLADKSLEIKAAPHAYELAEIIRAWVDEEAKLSEEGEPAEEETLEKGKLTETRWTEENWARVCPSNRPTPFKDYFYDHLVFLSQDGTVAWEQLIRGGQTATYRSFHNIEQRDRQDRIRRVIAAIGRMLDRRLACTIFACVFFVVHYWWDMYLEGDEIVRPLLDAWRETYESNPASDEIALLGALENVQNSYPVLRNYKAEIDSKQWTDLRVAVSNVQDILGIAEELPERPMSCHRYARAITLLYLAYAMQSAPDGADAATIEAHYQEAKKLFHLNEDEFHYVWAVHDHTEYLSERTEEDSLLLAAQYCEDGVEKALKNTKRKDEDEDREEEEDHKTQEDCEDLDSEVVASFYRLQADAVGKLGRSKEAQALHEEAQRLRKKELALRCAAVFTAYAWKDVWTEEGDRYAFEFYGEQVERTMDYLEALVVDRSDEADEACRFLGAFLQTSSEPLLLSAYSGKPFLREQVQPLLFPPQPQALTMQNGKIAAKRVLDGVLGRLEMLKSECSAYPLPRTFARVLRIISEEFPTEGE